MKLYVPKEDALVSRASQINRKTTPVSCTVDTKLTFTNREQYSSNILGQDLSRPALESG